jgi:hypothetical protein
MMPRFERVRVPLVAGKERPVVVVDGVGKVVVLCARPGYKCFPDIDCTILL